MVGGTSILPRGGFFLSFLEKVLERVYAESSAADGTIAEKR